ncbi:hypothetical protein Pelo_674 [Pelomyxa schiedti]|nr:hypothetical protein Pelo_674 [Pelomyxa schiedti]
MLWFFCVRSFEPVKFLTNELEIQDLQVCEQSLDEVKGTEAWWRAREITLQLVAAKLGNRAGGLQDPHLWKYNLKDAWSLVAFYLPYEGMTPEDQQRVVIDLVKAADCFMHPMFSPIRFTPTTVPLTATKIGTEVRESLNLPESPIVLDNSFLIWFE